MTKRGREILLLVSGIALILVGSIWAIVGAWTMLVLTGHLYDLESGMDAVYFVVATLGVAVIALWVRFVRRGNSA
ncbi:MAG TPA: hypothetical protein VGB91_13440 [Rhizomicrobium sp.]